MASIQIYDLRTSGADLFADPECFMEELRDASAEITAIQGGCTPFGLGVLASVVLGGGVLLLL